MKTRECFIRISNKEGLVKWFRLLPNFSFTNFVEQMLDPFEQVCNFAVSAEKSQKLVKIWKSNQV